MNRIRGAIASSVALEIERISKGQQWDMTEGAAYKAAWHRQGSDCLKLCQDRENDVELVGLLADGTTTAPTFAIFEAARGPR